jgi:uncharacterized protein YaaQ
MRVESLLIVVVQHEDADTTVAAMVSEGLRVTRISTTGAFLHTGNVTLLLELERDQVARALEILAVNCRTRMTYVNTAPPVPAVGVSNVVAPLEIEIGGASTFVLPVERFVRLGARREQIESEYSTSEGRMKLVMAICPEELATTVLDTLMSAQYRATLISTTGGWLRKGNATLLIGVEARQVDDVLNRIGRCCTGRAQGADDSCATVFVLDVEKYQRV